MNPDWVPGAPPDWQPCTPATARCRFNGWSRDFLRPGCCTRHLRQVLAFTEGLLTRHGIFHFLDGSALLGAVRSRTLIEWDSDAEFTCLTSDFDKVLALETEIAAAGFWLDKTGAPGLLSIQRGPVNHTHADLWFHSVENDVAYSARGLAGREKSEFPARYLEQVGSVTLEGAIYPAPMPVEQFLAEHRFGPDFMIPVRPAANASLPERLELKQVLHLLQELDPSSALFRRSRQLLDGKLEIQPSIPKATPPKGRRFLTIGTATANDYDGVYFTIQAIRLCHPEILSDVEFLVIDNDPLGPCAKALHRLAEWCPNYRYLPYRTTQGTAVRDLIFREATGDFVLCIDSHVLFPPGSLARFIEYCRKNPDSNDLLQGPLLSDAMEPIATHFEPIWSAGMYGRWGMDVRGKDVDAPPFEIGMQGLGVFGCRREAWPGFNPRLAGFGGEEGYIHLKIRRAGGRTLCLPFLRWLHRFERPMGISYACNWADRVRNYLLTHDELGLDPKPAISHFEEFLGRDSAQAMIRTVQAELISPFHFFDAIYCINLDRQPDRWEAMQRRFRKLGIERKVRRFSAADTPLNHHIGCALSHRRIIAEAKRQQLKTVLVFEDDARFSPDATDVLRLSLRELERLQWQLLYLGGYKSANSLREIPGCNHLSIPTLITCTHAIAYHCSVYDAILKTVPDDAIDVARWIRTHAAIDQFYTSSLRAVSVLTTPVIATQEGILAEESRVFDE